MHWTAPYTSNYSDAGGIPSCSRWLSAATPPDANAPASRTPAGVPSKARHALDPYLPPLPSHLRHETPGNPPRQGMAARTPRLSRRDREWTGPGEIRRHLRSALSRLIPPPMASLPDAGWVSFDVPVVSLRSTTGYRLGSRWDQDARAVRQTLIEGPIRNDPLNPRHPRN